MMLVRARASGDSATKLKAVDAVCALSPRLVRRDPWLVLIDARTLPLALQYEAAY